MPIQFRCPKCSKAVEVDAEFAMRSAQCPYCNAVVSVPDASTLTGDPNVAPPVSSNAGDWDAPVTPSAPPSLPQSGDGGMPPSLHIGPTGDRKQRTARRLAIISLVFGILAVGSYCGSAVLLVPVTQELAHDNPDLTTLDEESAAELRERLEQHPSAVWIGMGFYVGSLSAIIGLACGIVSLRFARRRNTIAWVGVVLSGVCALCLCSGVIVSIAMGTLGA